MKGKMKGNIMLLITALIWGTAFVAQSAGMEYVEPFTYNSIRTLIGGLFLIPIVLIFNKKSPKKEAANPADSKKALRVSIIGGIVCGIVMCIASSFQQVGISMTTAGKAGFVTALYVVIVPLMGIFIKKKIPKIIWLCVAIAVLGFYLLCIKEGFTIGKGDLLVLCCAVVFSIHILSVDYYQGKNVNGVLLSCIQLLVSGAIMLVPMFMFETPTLAGIWEARTTILYAGIMSCGIAYTLQVVGQKYTDPTSATLLMSLESVFAALSGWLILGESLSVKEFFGCVLVFIAVILAQVPLPSLKKKKK